jgi:hypothetical protein
MLRTLRFDVVRHVVLGVVLKRSEKRLRCCRHVMLGVVLRRREKRLLMLDVARNTGRIITAIWSQHGGEEKKDS